MIDSSGGLSLKNSMLPLLAFILATIFIFQQNCSRVGFSPKKRTDISSEQTPDPVDEDVVAQNTGAPQPATTAPKSCPFPGQQSSEPNIEHGKARFFAQPDSEFHCDKLELRSCNDGVLSGSLTERTCSVVFNDSAVETFKNCDSALLKHGEISIRFASESVPVGQTCVAQVRGCDDGVLSGSNQYNLPSCRVENGTTGRSCSLTWDQQTLQLPHNSRVFGFVKNAVMPNESCSFSTIKCIDGTLSPGSPSISSGCREKNIDELPNGYFDTGHDNNSANISFAYKLEESFQGPFCVVEYYATNQWKALPLRNNQTLNCTGAAGNIIKGSIDLSAITNFHWQTTTTEGATRYGLRLRFNIKDHTGLSLKTISGPKTIDCYTRAQGSPSPSPMIDENCNGQFDDQINGAYY